MTETAAGAAEARRRPAPFPHHYEVALEAQNGGALMTAPPRPVIAGGPPAQFGGRDDWWSPEHLMLSAVSLCLQGTFQVFATKEKLEVVSYRSLVKGILDRTPHGLRFVSIVLEADLTVRPGESERARRLLESAKEHCIVANGLRTPVDLRCVVTMA